MLGNEHVLIIGAGQSGVQLADSLREQGFSGKLSLIGDEPHLPYQRPPLSKDFLSDGAAPDPLPLRAPGFYAERDIALLRGTRAQEVDLAARAVTLQDGRRLDYDHLVFATGARNRQLPCPGGQLPGVRGLRDLDDARALHAQLSTARRVVVIGAGFIGLEFAAAARARGLQVTVLEFAPRPMGRAVSAGLADWFTAAHRAQGIDLRLGEGVGEIRGAADALQVVSSTGAMYDADLVVYGIGVLPNTELAAQAGIAVDNGIAVDGQLRTSVPGVYALGDCASFPNQFTGTRTRLESVQNATDQARTLAGTILGKGAGYGQLPWFWSTQGPIRLQIAGLSTPQDTPVLLGDPASGKFSIALLRDGVLAAVESVNRPADHIAARRLLAGGVPVDARTLASGASLKDLARSALPVPA